MGVEHALSSSMQSDADEQVPNRDAARPAPPGAGARARRVRQAGQATWSPRVRRRALLLSGLLVVGVAVWGALRPAESGPRGEIVIAVTGLH